MFCAKKLTFEFFLRLVAASLLPIIFHVLFVAIDANAAPNSSHLTRVVDFKLVQIFAPIKAEFSILCWTILLPYEVIALN